MKQSFYYAVSLSFCMHFICAENPPLPITINVTTQNNAASQSSATAQNVVSLYQWITSYSQAQKEYLSGIFQTLISHIFEHKLRYACYMAGGSYVVLLWYLQSFEYFLNDPTCWHNWPYDLASQQLMTYSQQELSQLMTRSIKERYFDSHNPIKQIDCIVHFFQAIKKERATLERGLDVTLWVKRLWISKLPFVHLPKKETIKNKLQRLSFLENLCKNWCLEMMESQRYYKN